MKTLYTLMLFMGLTLNAQTEVTNLLNTVCDNATCSDIQLGACPGDVNSLGEPYEFTDFEVYYVDENVIFNSSSLTLRNSRLEFRNGANFVDNDLSVNVEQDCDGENVTEIVFIGGGQRFSSVEDMNATLGIAEVNISVNDLSKAYGKPFNIISTSGQLLLSGKVDETTRSKTKQFKGIQILKIEGHETIKLVSL